MPLKIVFAGTPDIAATVLQHLIDQQHHLQAVYTQPDRPAGRGQKLKSSPVKTLSLEHQLTVIQPETLKTVTAQQTLKDIQPDLLIVIAYGLILPQAILDIPRLGGWNLHVSLLPKWRGAAPIQRAILAGDRTTGVTVMQMDAGLDTGDILHQELLDIDPQDTSQTLHDRLAQLACHALDAALLKLDSKQLKPQVQSEEGVSYAAKISKQEAWIDWQQQSQIIDQQVRAFNPFPIAQTYINDQIIRIYQTEVLSQTSTKAPGTIIHISKLGIDIACNPGVIRLKIIQLPTRRRLPIQDILNGNPDYFKVGQKCQNPPA